MTEVNRIVKEHIESNMLFRHMIVKGEVSNFTHHSSGHMYFTLKDERSRMRCVFFRGKNARLTFMPENGMQVITGGALTVYEVAGEYQLNVDEMHPAGVGALHVAFEQLKTKLDQEGLFDPEAKLPLPFLPRAVGVVTSPTGAALRDIVTVMRRRAPGVDIVLAPAIVQGEKGPESVVKAIERLNDRGGVDAMIVGRGGGSIEELWTFNDERVARAIFRSSIPIISAVGHETDVTIADFVADRRAPTPSVAAELAVPETASLEAELRVFIGRMQSSLLRNVSARRDALKLLTAAAVMTRPVDRIDEKRQLVDEWASRAETLLKQSAQWRRERFQSIAERLDRASPLSVLSRGYAICQKEETKRTVVDAATIEEGDRLDILLKRGSLQCIAIGKKIDENGGVTNDA